MGDAWTQARNGILGTPENNDFLEFVGDRLVNLMSALLVAEDNFSPDQHVIVDRLVSNNDTLGRLAHQLHLQRYAVLDGFESRRAADWDTKAPWKPPKVLADLFEAYVGAVYEEHGWDLTKDWLSTLFRPLIEKANEDYLRNITVPPRYPNKGTYVTHERLASPTIETEFYKFLESRAPKIVSTAEPALLMLPLSTKFIFGANGDIATDCDVVEIATHLVKFWSITLLVTNAWTFGYLGSMLKLSSCFDLNDPSFSIYEKPMKSPTRENFHGLDSDGIFTGKLAQALYSVIGWYYSRDAKVAEQWGIKWLIPLVVRAYDLIAQRPAFRPSFPEGIGNTNPYVNILVNMGRGPDVPLVTTQDELEEILTIVVLEGKETRGRVFLTKEDVRRINFRRRSI
ncbi:hypothetical protein NP233_g8988 [Leucocoprinus birnbaumii]|uniref:RNase III domain-containing protein n=1 Tax=Leucocoprinus birnbaumii TaxID=56174 RepID=A0AAD5VMZ7_9AGAR|nr:hypothetical protein NP233_g8988 [Leucocoprinus birnbaumii]